MNVWDRTIGNTLPHSLSLFSKGSLGVDRVKVTQSYHIAIRRVPGRVYVNLSKQLVTFIPMLDTAAVKNNAVKNQFWSGAYNAGSP